jgi:HdeA/HdeB family
MKKLFAFCAMTSLVLGEAAAEGRVDRIDLTGFTCKQFLAMNRDDALIVVGWLQGYYLDEHAPPVADFATSYQSRASAWQIAVQLVPMMT